MKKTMLFIAVLLGGCASNSGVIPAGIDSYMVSRQDGGIAGALGSLKAENLKDASEFCNKKGQKFTVLNSEDVVRALGKIPQSTLYFKCV